MPLVGIYFANTPMSRELLFSVCREFLYLGFVALTGLTTLAWPYSSASPWEMAVTAERWLVDEAGARFPDELADSARDSDNLVFIDDTWPLFFRTGLARKLCFASP